MKFYDWTTIVTYVTLVSGLIIQALQIKELKLRIRAHEKIDSDKRAVLVRPTEDEVKLYGKQPEGTNVDSSERTEKTATDTAPTVKLLLIGDGELEQTSRITVDQMKPAKEQLPKRRFWTLSHALAGVVIVGLVCVSLYAFKRTANAKHEIIKLKAHVQNVEDQLKKAQYNARIFPALDVGFTTQKQTSKRALIGNSKFPANLNVSTSTSLSKLLGTSELSSTKKQKKNSFSLGIFRAGN